MMESILFDPFFELVETGPNKHNEVSSYIAAYQFEKERRLASDMSDSTDDSMATCEALEVSLSQEQRRNLLSQMDSNEHQEQFLIQQLQCPPEESLVTKDEEEAGPTNMLTEEVIEIYCDILARYPPESPISRKFAPTGSLSSSTSSMSDYGMQDEHFCIADEVAKSSETVVDARAEDDDERIPSTVTDYSLMSSPESRASIEEVFPSDDDQARSPEDLPSPPSSPEVLSESGSLRRSSARRHKGKPRKYSQKQPLLWQFLLCLLSNAHYNPHYIAWEDRDRGIFKFIQSKKVAQLWGERRQRSDMSYEFFSRAMRHHYGRDVIQRVEGRRLVYQFLSKACGWQEVAAATPS